MNLNTAKELEEKSKAISNTSILDQIKNSKIVLPIVLLSAILVGIANFGDAIDKLIMIYEKYIVNEKTPMEPTTHKAEDNTNNYEKVDTLLKRVFKNCDDFLEKSTRNLPRSLYKAIEKENHKDPFGFGSSSYIDGQFNVMAEYIQLLDSKLKYLSEEIENIVLDNSVGLDYLKKNWISNEKTKIFQSYQKTLNDELIKFKKNDLIKEEAKKNRVEYILNKKLNISNLKIE
jgi:hypothetical protein